MKKWFTQRLKNKFNQVFILHELSCISSANLQYFVASQLDLPLYTLINMSTSHVFGRKFWWVNEARINMVKVFRNLWYHSVPKFKIFKFWICFIFYISKQIISACKKKQIYELYIRVTQKDSFYFLFRIININKLHKTSIFHNFGQFFEKKLRAFLNHNFRIHQKLHSENWTSENASKCPSMSTQ